VQLRAAADERGQLDRQVAEPGSAPLIIHLADVTGGHPTED
jgi:hypothetical protein